MTYRNSKGFTIIELLIFTAVLGLLAPLLAFSIAFVQTTSTVGSAQLKLQLDGKRSIETMADTLKQAKQILNQDNNYQSDGDTLIIALPGIDASQALLALDDVIIFDFDNIGKKLKQYIFPSSGSVRVAGSRTIANDVDAIGFSYIDKTGAEICGQSVTRRWSLIKKASATVLCDSSIDYTKSAKIRIEMRLKRAVGAREAKINLTDEIRLRNK